MLDINWSTKTIQQIIAEYQSEKDKIARLINLEDIKIREAQSNISLYKEREAAVDASIAFYQGGPAQISTVGLNITGEEDVEAIAKALEEKLKDDSGEGQTQ